MGLPSTMKAIKIVETGKAEIQDSPLPKLRDGTLLVKNSCVALNPTDWKHIDWMPTPGATVGCDFAGVVVEVGPNAGTRFKKGDRIAGVVHGANTLRHDSGCFGEYTVANPKGSFKIPDNVTDEEAAGMGVATATIGLCLYQKLALPMPGSIPAEYPILIYGGSSAMASVAIQYAKLSGAKVITTCSARNFDFVKSLGADEIFDYNDPDVGKKIREVTNDKLYHVMDCIGDGGAKICLDSLSSSGGQIATINSRAIYDRDDIRLKKVIAYSANGEPWRMAGNDFPATKEETDLANLYFRLNEKLMGEGKVKAHPPKTGQGLEGVLQGLDEMRQGKVSGVKLTYKI
ncbi:hypothetical protein M409DRAFT_24346 [Zasmidium cellare ATCC 36951]|uniref:Enoyl reductase (ER) domain-containing protein n=1 Tax=Zasmidium cellare ATCC 36951 TaxID=1080233 RepID=A0A6A6CFS0_ZASCE|nr:uncharacterized protein M409DRAFT_24346 [Zasmidium cellare ATCC 36951]KAF2165493.1 hypothetical protein M409DRAFT_24346 [Zasmidium cellare ATCC 36951]